MKLLTIHELTVLGDFDFGVCIDCGAAMPGVPEYAEEMFCGACSCQSVMGVSTIIELYPEIIDFECLDDPDIQTAFERYEDEL